MRKVIDSYNPGVTLLALVWVIAFTARAHWVASGSLSQVGYEALTSLVYVVPIMLVGWGAQTLSKRVFGLDLFGRSDD